MKSRGFGLLPEELRRELASKGGLSVAADKRTFHTNPEQAKAAGAKGGAAGKGRPKPRKQKPSISAPEAPDG